MYRPLSVAVLAVVVGCGAAACSRTQASGGGTASVAWVQNGANACARLLTADVVASLLTVPTGAAQTLSPQACSWKSTDSGGSITITLTNAGPETFDHYQQYLVDPKPLAGVGDKASQSMVGIDAVKGADRTCTIDAGGAPGSLKVSGADLGQKLGALCNQLFALP